MDKGTFLLRLSLINCGWGERVLDGGCRAPCGFRGARESGLGTQAWETRKPQGKLPLPLKYPAFDSQSPMGPGQEKRTDAPCIPALLVTCDNVGWISQRWRTWHPRTFLSLSAVAGLRNLFLPGPLDQFPYTGGGSHLISQRSAAQGVWESHNTGQSCRLAWWGRLLRAVSCNICCKEFKISPF